MKNAFSLIVAFSCLLMISCNSRQNPSEDFVPSIPSAPVSTSSTSSFSSDIETFLSLIEEPKRPDESLYVEALPPNYTLFRYSTDNQYDHFTLLEKGTQKLIDIPYLDYNNGLSRIPISNVGMNDDEEVSFYNTGYVKDGIRADFQNVVYYNIHDNSFRTEFYPLTKYLTKTDSLTAGVSDVSRGDFGDIIVSDNNITIYFDIDESLYSQGDSWFPKIKLSYNPEEKIVVITFHGIITQDFSKLLSFESINGISNVSVLTVDVNTQVSFNIDAESYNLFGKVVTQHISAPSDNITFWTEKKSHV